MIPELEMTLSFDGDEWIAAREDFLCHAGYLDVLEDRIANWLQQNPHYAGCKTVYVWLLFDLDAIPVWLRQYHSHYFNNRIAITLPREDPAA